MFSINYIFVIFIIILLTLYVLFLFFNNIWNKKKNFSKILTVLVFILILTSILFLIRPYNKCINAKFVSPLKLLNSVYDTIDGNKWIYASYNTDKDNTSDTNLLNILKLNHNDISFNICTINNFISDIPLQCQIDTHDLKNYITLKYCHFYIRSSFNTCAINTSEYTCVSIDALKSALQVGCRFLDFDICSINDSPSVVIFNDNTSVDFKHSYNHIPLETVANTILNTAFDVEKIGNANDPLILHLKIRTLKIKVINKIADILYSTFQDYRFKYDDILSYADKNFQNYFNIPIEYCKRKIMFVVHAFNTLDVISPDNYEVMIKNSRLNDVMHSWSRIYNSGKNYMNDICIINDDIWQKDDDEDNEINRMYMYCPTLVNTKMNTDLYHKSMEKMKYSLSYLIESSGNTILKPNIIPFQIQSFLGEEKNNFFTFFKSKNIVDNQLYSIGLKQKYYKESKQIHIGKVTQTGCTSSIMSKLICKS